MNEIKIFKNHLINKKWKILGSNCRHINQSSGGRSIISENRKKLEIYSHA
jgi:hypothetical protein